MPVWGGCPQISGVNQSHRMTVPLQTLPIYTGVFGKSGMATLLIAVVMGLMVPWLNRMMNVGQTEAEGLVAGQAQVY